MKSLFHPAFLTFRRMLHLLLSRLSTLRASLRNVARFWAANPSRERL